MNNRKYELFFGRLVSEPDMIFPDNGDVIIKLTVAVNDRKTGVIKNRRVVVKGRDSGPCSILNEGSEIFVQGQSSHFSIPMGDELEKVEEVIAWDVGIVKSIETHNEC